MNKLHNNYFYFFAFVFSFLFPDFILGFSLEESTFKDTVNYIRLDFIAVILPILSALAFIVFFWGLSKFILNADKPAEIQNGKKYMMWGILALFVLLTWRTIISLISNELEIGDSKNYPLIPKVESGQGGVGPGSSGFNRP